MDEPIEIVRATEATPELTAAIAALLPQLVPASRPSPAAEPPDEAHLRRLVASDATHLFVARSGDRIVGMLTLVLAPIPSGWHAYIEDVVVDEAFRNRGLAERLVDGALDAAARTGAAKIDLTSHATREAANRLYLRLGFELRETNVYRYVVDES